LSGENSFTRKKNKMKKLTLCLLTTVLLVSYFPTQMSAASGTVPTAMTATTTGEPTEVTTLTARLSAIDAMDKSNLSASEKKALRKEVRSTKRQLSQISGGIYLSGGAVLLILLLLIILL
jgi:hypothetical protein